MLRAFILLATLAVVHLPQVRKPPSAPPTVYVHDYRGVVIGADPDPRIRQEILRDNGSE